MAGPCGKPYLGAAVVTKASFGLVSSGTGVSMGGYLGGTEAAQGRGAGRYLLEALKAHPGLRESDRASWRCLWTKAASGWGGAGPQGHHTPRPPLASYLWWEGVQGQLAPRCPPGPVGQSLPGVWLGGKGFWVAAWGRQATPGGAGWQQRHLGDRVPLGSVCPVAR